ncbi:DUF2934 domain-containing protein (plasmid) [Lichenicola cladoniae]|uniref:DUF2934 domain-containing protein n=1 Tax=Lichenicola cladoniae TaxID=1484109 RepID=A0A6M8HZ29_9PROT|nr:DUF2934 domain-containing protein [Lichenicola cladoniae]NPD67664.1 DUF2934 domain-containing protein [Acetobacteraceae bacterium]QKE93824.1 DUF2934 domain-containing protein [Lichenicola cladoniae]
MSNSTSTLVERVQHRAYELWEKDGQPEDKSEYFWLQAQLEIGIEDAEAVSIQPVMKQSEKLGSSKRAS